MTRALVVRALIVASTFAASAPLTSQQPVDSTVRRPGPPATMDRRLKVEIAILSRLLGSVDVPEAERFHLGDHEVTPTSNARGTVATARGNLVVRGRIAGDALVLHGDLLVYPGGSIGGNAVAVDGRVHIAGGVVEGDVRSIRGVAGSILARAAGRASESAPPTVWSELKVVFGWFAVLFLIGIGVLLFAERNLDGVVTALERDFSRSFWVGALAQVAAIPALMLLVVALVISLLGILLIPFAVVAYVVALAGLVTIGFLAVSRFTGQAFLRGGTASRAVHLRALFAGLVVYVGLWFLAALFVWSPIVGSVMRAVALAGSWVGLTFGLGATIISRAGTRSDRDTSRRAPAADDLSWQTPTPVSGVVAARRPVAVVKDAP